MHVILELFSWLMDQKNPLLEFEKEFWCNVTLYELASPAHLVLSTYFFIRLSVFKTSHDCLDAWIKFALFPVCWVYDVKMVQIVIHARTHSKFLGPSLFLWVSVGLSLCLSKEQRSSGCDRNILCMEEWKKVTSWILKDIWDRERECEKKRATLDTGIKHKPFQDLPKAS